MSLNATVVLQYLERKLGASHHQLELNKEDLIRTVVEETLPTFSNFFPYRTRIFVDPVKDLVEENLSGMYYLKTEFEVLGVAKIFHNHIESGLPNLTSYYGDPFDRQLEADMRSMVENPILFQWHPPDKVEVFPKSLYWQQFLVELKVVHPKHMVTIPMNLREEFLKLALYDVQDSLHKIRNHFSSINTTFGSIELFLQDLEQAADKREELLEKWRTNFHKSASRKKVWVY